MSNLLHELENNEAILLMYLAGELPEEDRLEVEQMLASDPALRAELAELAALQAELTGVVARVDGGGGADMPRREAVVRQVSRAMTAARLQPLAAKTAPAPAPRFRLHIAWWAYPIVAAALLVVGIMLLSDNRPLNLPSPQTDHTQLAEITDQQSAQIFPAELEKELISLNSDGTDLFSPASPELDR